MEKTVYLDSTQRPPLPQSPDGAHFDPIGDLVRLPTQLTSQQVCESDPEQIQYWMDLIASPVTHIPGRQFGDYFSRERIKHYRDDQGLRLPGLRSMVRDGVNYPATWYEIPPQDSTLAVADQENYIRLKLLPRFAACMIQHFSVAVFALQQTDAPRFGPSYAEGFLEQVFAANRN